MKIIKLQIDINEFFKAKKFSKIRKSTVSETVRARIDKMLSSDKQKEFEDTELFKWFGKYKYIKEIKKIE